MNDIQPRIKHLSPVRHTRIKHLYMNDIQPFSCHHWGILYVHPRKTYFTCSGTPLYTVLPVMSPTSTKNKQKMTFFGSFLKFLDKNEHL